MVADRELLLDGVLLRGDARPQARPEGSPERAAVEPGLPRLVGAQELGRLLGSHLGRLLAMAGQRFDSRVLVLMAHSADLSLALSHLAARGRLGASHIQITRHLPLAGCSVRVQVMGPVTCTPARTLMLGRSARMSSAGLL